MNGVRELSLEKFDRISRFVEWDDVFGFSSEDVRKVVEASSLFHDVGKATPYFQKKLRGEKGGKLSQHALVSSLITAHMLREEGLPDFLIYCGYSIVKNHHSHLRTPMSDLIEERDLMEKILDAVDESFLKQLGIEEKPDLGDLLNYIEDVIFDATYYGKEGYFLIKMLYSILVTSDREDVIFQGEHLETTKLDPEKIEAYLNGLRIESPIDELRADFQRKISEFDEFNAGLYTLTAPTGIGKTLANLRLSLKLLQSEDSIVVYALPLINIIEQTADVARTVFEDESVLEYHHLTDIFGGDEPDERYYESISKIDLRRRTWSYPLVITTFVSLLENLIGDSKCLFLHRLPGGVVILDEVQSIPYELWAVVKEVLEFLPKIGVKVLLSTATMPAIFQGVEVLKDGDRFFRSLNRVVINVHERAKLDEFKRELIETLRDGKSSLIIMNTVKSAEEVFDALSEEFENVCFLSSRVMPLHRRERILDIKSGKYDICVSTQVIEAGVDVSFDRVIRDIGPIDSVVQSSGRCNRNFKHPSGEVHVIPIEDDRTLISKYVYGKFLIEKSLEIFRGIDRINESEFRKYIDRYYRELLSYGDIDRNNFKKALEELDISVLGRFRVIEDRGMNVSFLLLYDENAEMLFEKLQEISEETEGIIRHQLISAYLSRLSPYIVSTRVPQDINELGAFETAFGLVIIRRDSVKNWYDPVKGLRFEGGEGVFI